MYYNIELIFSQCVELDYIHIYLHSACTSGARGITRNALARAIDTRFEVIDKWYHGHVMNKQE